MTRTTRSLLWSMLLAGAVALAVLAAACGGGDDDDDDDSAAEATATSSAEATDEPSGDDDDTGDDDSGDDDDDGGDALSELQGLGSEFAEVSGKVTYEFTSEGDEAASGNMTLYSDPPNSRIDFETPDGVVIIINTPEASYFCTEAEDEGFCIESEGDDTGQTIPFLSDFADPDSFGDIVDTFGGVDISTSTEEIAGADASCFSYSGTVEGETGTGKFCFADSGLLLLAEFSGDVSGDFTMRATEFSDEVSGSDFEPPYDTLDFGAIPTP